MLPCSSLLKLHGSKSKLIVVIFLIIFYLGHAWTQPIQSSPEFSPPIFRSAPFVLVHRLFLEEGEARPWRPFRRSGDRPADRAMAACQHLHSSPPLIVFRRVLAAGNDVWHRRSIWRRSAAPPSSTSSLWVPFSTDGA